jgi:hypothetical protein
MGYIRGLIHGAVIGTIVGVCIAPQEGRRTREQLQRTAATVQQGARRARHGGSSARTRGGFRRRQRERQPSVLRRNGRARPGSGGLVLERSQSAEDAEHADGQVEDVDDDGEVHPRRAFGRQVVVADDKAGDRQQ